MSANILFFLLGGVLGYFLYSIRLRLLPIPHYVFRAIFDGVPRTVIVFRRDKRYHYFAPSLEKLFGRSLRKYIGQTHADHVRDGIITPVPVGVDEALAGAVFEERLVPTILSGEVIGWRKGIYWPIRNARGTVVNAIFFAQRMEEAMESIKDAHRKAMILACVKDAVIVVDLNYRITDWNQAAEDLYGFTVQEAHGQSVRELLRSSVTEDERAESRVELGEIGAWQGRSTRYTKSGQRLIVESHAAVLRDQEGTVIGYIGIDREITEQAEIEAALRDSEERYRSLFENALEGIFRCTLQGEFIEVNPALIELLGYDSAEDVLALTLPEHVRLLIQHTPPSMINVLDLNWQKKDGEPLVIDLSAQLITDEDGKPLYFDGTIFDVTERKQAEEALRNSEARFRTLVENGSDIITVLDNRARPIYVSPSIHRVLGYTLTDYSNSNPATVIHPDDMVIANEFFAQFLEGAPPNPDFTPVNVRVRHVDGSWRDMEVTRSGTPLNYPGLKGIVVNARDVTERKLFNEKLRRQNEYLTALNETTLSLMERLDLEELLEDIISRAGTLLGAPQGYIFLPEQDSLTMKARVVVGMPKRFKGYLLERGQGLSGRVWETGQPIVVNSAENWSTAQYDFKSSQFRASIAAPLKSGHVIVGVLGLAHTDPTLTFSPDEIEMFHRFAELASIALDNARLYGAAQKELVDRTRAEEELRQLNVELEERVDQRTAELARREAQLSGVLNAMGEGVFFSESFGIRYTNRALAEMTGYQIDELIGQPNAIFKSSHASPEDATRFAEDFVVPGQVWRGELTIRRKDGTEFPAGLTVARVADVELGSFGAVTVVRDITREKELAEQKSAFLANASHELRTPLTNFKTRLYLLRKQPARLEDHVAILDRVTDRMTSLVEDLLDASRFERGVIPLQQDDVILQPLIEDVVLLQQPEAQRKNIQLTTNLPDDPTHVYADANRIVQVLVNLVVNAINYTEDNGKVAVDLLAQEHMVVIRVQDTGLGIRPEHLSRVFEAFFRGSEGSIQGTGLGLFISKQIIDLHHGSLTVDSQRGEGTTFTVCLPLRDPNLNEGDKIGMFK